jgi:tryptophan synthase alpha chain
MKIAIQQGADALELGFWFSDPIADGPSVQEADLRAKNAGMDVDKAFDLMNKIRDYDPNIPIGMLVYYQLVLARTKVGKDFCEDAANAGADGILIPDLPIEYIGNEADTGPVEDIDFHGLDKVCLVAPSTTDERLAKIASQAKGFVYQVARRGVTGAREELEESTLSLVARTRSYTERYHNTPIVVGFGISKPEHVSAVLKAGADGAITGSALCNIIKEHLKSKKDMYSAVSSHVKSIKQATFK